MGSCRLLDAPAGLLAYERSAGSDRRLVLVNFTADLVPYAATGRIDVSSDGNGEGAAFAGLIAPAQAVVIGGY